ncbi:MAG: serine hydrolase [Desulfobacteraceae bacterium]|nr:serine hydrolase [Desulfobacteraceae bacterium]
MPVAASESHPASAAEEVLTAGRLRPRIGARAAIILDAGSGDTLFACSPDLPGQPASTIKIITGLIAIDSLSKDAQVIVSSHAAAMPPSKVYLKAGRSYRAGDLINSVLLASANDAAVALGEKIGGSESTFAALMTAKARQLGATNTVCMTANGLTARGQRTTPRDLAVMFNQIMKNQEFAERIRRVQVTTSFGALLRNHNRALWQVAGAEGGKTGYTCAAGQTYVGKFRRGESELLVALMGSHTMWQDVNTLVKYGFASEAKLAANRSRKHFGSEIVQVKQLGKERPNPLLVVLTDRKKVSL